mgnify:CR=1 FL=1
MSPPARIRLLVAATGSTFLVLAGLLLSIPLLVGDPLPVVRPSSAHVPLNHGATSDTSAQIQVRAGGSFVLNFTLAPDTPQAPRVFIRMPSHGMVAPVPIVSTMEGNRFFARGQLAMPGRWEITVERGEHAETFSFILAEF